MPRDIKVTLVVTGAVMGGILALVLQMSVALIISTAVTFIAASPREIWPARWQSSWTEDQPFIKKDH